MINFKCGDRIERISNNLLHAVERPRNLYRFAKICLIAGLIFFLKAIPSYSQNQSETIKIGFLIRDKNDIATQQAAELAIEFTNARGGYQGIPFELITKSCDGPWGIGSKQVVSLVFDDEVSMIVGALDGRNAHLAEQVTAKTHIVMLSTLSSDQSLSRAYVPWYYRLVPDDSQQIEALVEEIYENEKFKNIALIALDNYDGKMSLESMLKKTKEKDLPISDVFYNLKQNELLNKINNNVWDAIVLSGSSINVSETNKIIQGANRKTKIYAFLNLFNFMNDYQGQFMGNIKIVIPFDMNNLKWKSFEKTYRDKYEKTPSPSMAFVYDGIMLSIKAIEKLGPDSENIRKGFRSVIYNGITGSIEFDKLGDRINLSLITNSL